MPFGQNLHTWLMGELQWVVPLVLAVIAIAIGAQRKVSAFIVFIVVALVICVFVYNPFGVADALVALGNQILGI